MSFIVIEGLDGSGKSTQVKMFKQYLQNQDISYQYIHFPVTDSPVFGELVAKFLRGELGKNDEVNPYLVALLYAGDRNNFKEKLNDWLSRGYVVLADRYVHSNIAFQCAKIDQYDERQKLREWIYSTEYSYFKIPLPDKSVFLDVPFDFVKSKLVEERKGSERDYLKGKEDIHEADLDFQERVRNEYLELSQKDNSLERILCYNKEGDMLSPNIISEKVIHAFKPYL